jgi:hypothetical protein
VSATRARHGREIFDELRSLCLPAGGFAVFGSGPLLVRGIIDSVSDLDVLCRGRAWAVAQQLAGAAVMEHGVPVVSIGAISFGTTWGLGEFDADSLIDGAEIIDGLPFVGLEHVVAYKQAAGRAKDLEHLGFLAAWERRQETPS